MKLNLEGIGSVHDLVHDIRWSGPELAHEAHRRAAALRPYCQPGENLFVITHGNSPAFFADLFAVWEVGACAVCVNPGLTQGELDNVTAFVEARAVLADGGSAGTEVMPVVGSAQGRAQPGPAAAGHSALDDPALILFTSGTTGDPKGVQHSYRSILARLALNQAHIGGQTLARALCVLPTHFGHGLIGNCLTPLLCGGDVFLMHGTGVAGAAGLGDVLTDHQISFMSSVPAFWKVALRVAQPPASATLRRVHIGSAPLSSELWQGVMDWSGTREVANMYGITETANWIGGALASQLQPEDGLLGTPWGGQFAVAGEDGSPRSHGEGEILLQVPSLMSGYYRRPDLTTEVLRQGWYHTGDTGSIDAQGVLRMTGRNRYAINRGGMKVYPEELDLLLERHPDVMEACAFGISDPVSGENVAVALRLRDGAGVGKAELIDWTRAHIRADAVPGRVFLVPDIPKTDRGKLNRDTVARFCLDEGATL